MQHRPFICATQTIYEVCGKREVKSGKTESKAAHSIHFHDNKYQTLIPIRTGNRTHTCLAILDSSQAMKFEHDARALDHAWHPCSIASKQQVDQLIASVVPPGGRGLAP